MSEDKTKVPKHKKFLNPILQHAGYTQGGVSISGGAHWRSAIQVLPSNSQRYGMRDRGEAPLPLRKLRRRGGARGQRHQCIDATSHFLGQCFIFGALYPFQSGLTQKHIVKHVKHVLQARMYGHLACASLMNRLADYWSCDVVHTLNREHYFCLPVHVSFCLTVYSISFCKSKGCALKRCSVGSILSGGGLA
jgi:hypothetical protein